ncbi:hypothetical protein GGF42_005154 [Coemansia sp. RSA 2424]|nr:hypothetical protein GGF42_005154 [Coemansia sp. RSA 2424]
MTTGAACTSENKATSMDKAGIDQAATSAPSASHLTPATVVAVNQWALNVEWAVSTFEKHVPQFCGSEDKMSSVAWTKKAYLYLGCLFNGAPVHMKYYVLLDRLTGEAKMEFEEPGDMTAEGLITNIIEKYPVRKH